MSLFLNLLVCANTLMPACQSRQLGIEPRVLSKRQLKLEIFFWYGFGNLLLSTQATVINKEKLRLFSLYFRFCKALGSMPFPTASVPKLIFDGGFYKNYKSSKVVTRMPSQELDNSPSPLRDEKHLKASAQETKKKLEDSKVSLIKEAEFLEILMLLILWGGFLGLFAFLIYWVEFPYKIIFGLFILPFLFAIIPLGWIFCSVFFQSTRLCINQEQISLTYKLLWSRRDEPLSSLRQDISKLERTKRYIKLIPADKTLDGVVPEHTRVIEPEIIIWAGKQKYKLASSSPSKPSCISEADLNWLAYEISDFLGLPITEA